MTRPRSPRYLGYLGVIILTVPLKRLYSRYKNYKLFKDRNKPSVNNKRSFINHPYSFLATRFVYNYTHYQAISVTNFS